jgi:hypothetical protein
MLPPSPLGVSSSLVFGAADLQNGERGADRRSADAQRKQILSAKHWRGIARHVSWCRCIAGMVDCRPSCNPRLTATRDTHARTKRFVGPRGSEWRRDHETKKSQNLLSVL